MNFNLDECNVCSLFVLFNFFPLCFQPSLTRCRPNRSVKVRRMFVFVVGLSKILRHVFVECRPLLVLSVRLRVMLLFLVFVFASCVCV